MNEPTGEIVDAREAKSERDRFEAWMQRYHADEWPNPGEDCSYQYLHDGTYRNLSLQARWEAWQAAQDPAEVADRAQRLEFAATALAVVERKRDELEDRLAAAREQLKKQPQFAVLKGCQPGDVAFLTPGRELRAEEAAYLREQCHLLHRETSIKVVILPAGFSVDAKDATDESAATCLYTFDTDFKANPATGYDIGDQRYKTGCGQSWLVSMGRSVYPFCAWCGKPVQTDPSANTTQPGA